MEFAGIYEELSANGDAVIGISSDSFDSCRDLRERLSLPFRIYSDPACEMIKAMGIFHDDEPKNRQIARPAVYVLDAERIIRYRYVGKSSRDRPVTADLPKLIESV